MRRKLTSLTILILALALVLSGCGDDDAAMTTVGARASEDRETTATTSAATTTTAAASRNAAAEGGTDGVGGTGAVPAVFDATSLGRSIVFTAAITVEVDDVVSAGKEAQAAVAGLGGILFGQETRTGADARSTLTIKVPPANFAAALERLSGIGELVDQTVFADDVTERVVDLQSQITTSEASVERLRSFLDTAADLEDLAALETELLRRETDLEILRGRLRTLEDQVALATIVLTLAEPTDPTPEPAIELIQTGYLGNDGGQGCPGADDIVVDEGESFTACYTLTNTGDSFLDDIDLRDRGLDADLKDLVLVEGDLESPLAPEGVIVLAFETDDADPRMYMSPEVTARAVDESGARLRQQVETSVEFLTIDIVEDTSLPGFMDAMRSAARGLQRVIGVAIVVAGAAVPFLWVPILVVGVAWYLDRRRKQAAVTTSTPEPPAPDTDAD